MKKLVLLIGCLIFGLNIFSQQKNLIDGVGYIMLQDSSATDTTYAPIFIPKAGTVIETDKRNLDGGIVLHFWNNNQRAMVTLDSDDFNAFDSNTRLGAWLQRAIAEEYNKKFSYDGSDQVIDIQYWIVTLYDTLQSYHDTIVYDGTNVDSTYTKY